MSVTITENQRKWLEALRSGKFTQGRGNLRSMRDEMCCLGVACELAQADGVEMRVEDPNATGAIFDRWMYDGRGGMPANKVRDWLGISDGQADRLADLNDTGSSFQEIADAFEQGDLR